MILLSTNPSPFQPLSFMARRVRSEKRVGGGKGRKGRVDVGEMGRKKYFRKFSKEKIKRLTFNENLKWYKVHNNMYSLGSQTLAAIPWGGVTVVGVWNSHRSLPLPGSIKKKCSLKMFGMGRKIECCSVESEIAWIDEWRGQEGREEQRLSGIQPPEI